MAKKKITFETLIEETEELVEQLESGELGLDEAIKAYEIGTRNLHACAKQLAQAEKTVEKLIAETEETFRLEPLDGEGDSEYDDEA